MAYGACPINCITSSTMPITLTRYTLTEHSYRSIFTGISCCALLKVAHVFVMHKQAKSERLQHYIKWQKIIDSDISKLTINYHA